MNPDLQNAVRRLIDAGCHYRLDALTACHSRPPKASYGVAPPRNTAVAFQPSEVQDGIGYVIATRRLDLGAGEKRIAFNLMLRQNATGDWLVFREHAFIPGDA